MARHSIPPACLATPFFLSSSLILDQSFPASPDLEGAGRRAPHPQPQSASASFSATELSRMRTVPLFSFTPLSLPSQYHRYNGGPGHGSRLATSLAATTVPVPSAHLFAELAHPLFKNRSRRGADVPGCHATIAACVSVGDLYRFGRYGPPGAKTL